MLALMVLLVPPAILLIYRFVPPPGTPLMVIRLVQGYGIDKDWTGIERISSNLQRAVLASEDAKFCNHNGFDWVSLKESLEKLEQGERSRGASTITMQTAKNLFLWPGRSFIRKGIEAYLTVWIELLWPKQRTLEVYLNIAEWGKGIYGAEAAARHYFGVPASALTARQSALLAVSLPSPLRSNPAKPTGYLSSRAGVIQGRMNSVPYTRDGVCN
ncbi:monofunctional biosynthetic peptidoglycan transglycosylase [Iodidimonas sp. SYSU 1G8]|uniref:monofunctional biosynthetic peptidoglycan transglycosylase n=1 Tax=Iodidimonas sp. SYSU 1G8 TaxID=3133967 RepID=UPI0031FE859E